MSIWALWAVTVLYGITSIQLFLKGNYPMALCFGSYAVANVALIWAIAKGFPQ